MTNLSAFDTILMRGVSFTNLLCVSEGLACLISIGADVGSYQFAPIGRIVADDGEEWKVGGGQLNLCALLQSGRCFKMPINGLPLEHHADWMADAVSVELVDGRLIVLGFVSTAH